MKTKSNKCYETFGQVERKYILRKKVQNSGSGNHNWIGTLTKIIKSSLLGKWLHGKYDMLLFNLYYEFERISSKEDKTEL